MACNGVGLAIETPLELLTLICPLDQDAVPERNWDGLFSGGGWAAVMKKQI